MLTEREQATRNALLRELGGLSFAEKQNIAEHLDPAFLDRELATFGRQHRRRKWLCAACIVYVVATLGAIGLELERWTPPVLVLIGVLWGLGYLQQCDHLRKRSAIYRALQALARGGRGQTVASDRVERNLT
jgi:hypothetical protein